jgi:fluoride exporter
MAWLAVGVGGALGSLARHAVNIGIARALGSPVPYATATVNLLGSFGIGVLAGLVAIGRLQMTPTMRVFVFVGILGGFTTFSSFGLDTFTLVQGGDRPLAFWNIVLQVGVGLLAVFLGFRAAHI